MDIFLVLSKCSCLCNVVILFQNIFLNIQDYSSHIMRIHFSVMLKIFT